MFIITALFKGENSIADKIDAAEYVAIPVIVLGELEYGAMYFPTSSKKQG